MNHSAPAKTDTSPHAVSASWPTPASVLSNPTGPPFTIEVAAEAPAAVNVTEGVNIYLPWYIGDYLAQTPHLSTLEHGAYLLLHAAYWSKGSLPSDPRSLQRITKLQKRQFEKVWPVLAPFFVVRNGLLAHQKLDSLAEDCRRRKDKQQKRASHAAKERWKPKSDATSIPQALLGECPSTSTSTPTKTSFSGGQTTQWQSGREKDNLDAVVAEVAARYKRSDSEVEGWLREHAARLSLLPNNPYPTAQNFRRFADAKVRMPDGPAPVRKLSVQEAKTIREEAQRELDRINANPANKQSKPDSFERELKPELKAKAAELKSKISEMKAIIFETTPNS